MKYLSLFSGIGGFELGIQQAMPNAVCVGFSEIDKTCISIYNKHFKGHINYGDIDEINYQALPRFDALVGGFPCQPFSTAGKRQGFDDARGTMFFKIVQILKNKRPSMFVLENVKGLLSNDNGQTFKFIIAKLVELGYSIQWQVLNSSNHGVPQNRERVFIVGHFGGECRAKIFPLTETQELLTKERKNKSQQANTLMTRDYANWRGNFLVRPKQLIAGQQGNRVYSTDGASITLSSQTGGIGGNTGLYAIPVLTPDRKDKRQNGRRFKQNGEPSFTLTSQDKHGVLVNSQIRRLTPKECERLQGFPDDFTKYGMNNKQISDSQRYRVLGNAVTVNVVAAIFNKIKEV